MVSLYTTMRRRTSGRGARRSRALTRRRAHGYRCSPSRRGFADRRAPRSAPRDAGEVEEGDPAVTEVVRRERRHTGCGAGAAERSPEPIAAEALSRLVEVAPRQPLELAEAHTRRIEDEQRQAVPARQNLVNGADVLGG